MAILKNLARNSTQQPQQTNPNQRGTGFTNLNRIIQANKDNKLGQAVSGGIQQVGQKVQDETQQAQQKFQQEAQTKRLDTQEAADKRSGILGRFGQQDQQPQAQTTGVNQDNLPNQQEAPKPIVSDDEIKDFTRFRTGTYTGPKELENYGSLMGKATQAEQVGDLSRSSGGRQELLRRFVGGQGYTQGQQRLDTTLLGQGNQDDINKARRGLRTMEEDVSRAGQASRGLAQEYSNRAKQFGQETSGMIQQTRDPISGAIDTRVSDAQAAEKARQDNIAKVQRYLTGDDPELAGLDKTTRLGIGLDMASKMGILSQDDLSKIQSQNLLGRGMGAGVDLNTLFNERLQNQAAQNLGRGGLASEQERAQLTALDRLAGKVGTDVEFNQAGDQFKAGSSRFDLDSLENYIRQTEDERSRADAAYAAEVEKERSKYINQAMGGYGQSLSSGIDVAANAVDFVNPFGDSALDPMAKAQNLLSTVNQGVIQAPTQFMNANTQATAGILDQLANTSFGGKKVLGDTASKQLSDVIKFGSDLSNKATGAITDVGNTFGNLDTYENMIKDFARAGGDIANIGSSVLGSVGGLIANPIAAIFCFTANTKICMADGKYKKVKDLKLDDEVALGGKITAIGESRTDDLFDVNGVNVSGGHAIFYKGKWMRAKDVPSAYPVGKEEKVYPISTELHLLVTENQIWADMEEVSNTYNKTDDEIIDELNNNKARNYKLMKFTEEYFNGYKKIRK
jgi:hypothetical protein